MLVVGEFANKRMKVPRVFMCVVRILVYHMYVHVIIYICSVYVCAGLTCSHKDVAAGEHEHTFHRVAMLNCQNTGFSAGVEQFGFVVVGTCQSIHIVHGTTLLSICHLVSHSQP